MRRERDVACVRESTRIDLQRADLKVDEITIRTDFRSRERLTRGGRPRWSKSRAEILVSFQRRLDRDALSRCGQLSRILISRIVPVSLRSNHLLMLGFSTYKINFLKLSSSFFILPSISPPVMQLPSFVHYQFSSYYVLAPHSVGTVTLTLNGYQSYAPHIKTLTKEKSRPTPIWREQYGQRTYARISGNRKDRGPAPTS